MSINTIDAIQDVAAQSSTKKQTGNLSAYLFKNSPGARETGAFTDSVVGLTQTTAKGLAEVFETIAHPQKLSKIQNMAKNTIREIFGYKDENDNRKAGQIKRYASKHRHEPHKPNISYKNTQSSHTIAPLSSDPRYKKLIKFPFYAGGKVIKIPARTLATVSHAIADTGERRQQQELRHMIHGKFTKADRSKTKSSRNKLTSRSSTTTEAPTKENKTSSRRGRLPRNRKKKTPETKKEPQESKKVTKEKESDKKTNTKQENKLAKQQEEIKKQEAAIKTEKEKLKKEKEEIAKERKELDMKKESQEKNKEVKTILPTSTKQPYAQKRHEREKESEKHIDVMKKEIKTMKDTFNNKADRSNKDTLGEYVEEYATLENIAKDIQKTGKRKKMGKHEKKKRQKALESYQELQEPTKIAA